MRSTVYSEARYLLRALQEESLEVFYKKVFFKNTFLIEHLRLTASNDP